MNDPLKFKLFLATVQKECKLRSDLIRDGVFSAKRQETWLKFHYDVFYKQMREIEYPLSEEELILAAKALNKHDFFYMLSQGDTFIPMLRNQLADEYGEQRRALNAPHRAVFEASAWKNPSCDPIRDEDTIETQYRRKHDLGWNVKHGKSLAQLAEDLYGLEWVTAYKAVMANDEGMFSAERYAEQRYWELRGENSLHHQYRRAVADYLWWTPSRDTQSFQFYRNRAIELRIAVRAAGQSTLVYKESSRV